MRPFLKAIGFKTIAFFALAASACSGAAQVTPGTSRSAAHPITHVVIVVQENRSFNDIFLGFPGANTKSYGYASDGRKIPLQPIGLATPWDIGHSSYSFLAACRGAGAYPGRSAA